MLKKIMVTLLAILLVGCSGVTKGEINDLVKRTNQSVEDAISEIVIDPTDEYLYFGNNYENAKYITKDGKEITIEGEIDYTKQGEYLVTMKYEDKDGNIVESQKIVYVGNATQINNRKQELAKARETKEAKTEQKPATAESSSSNQQMSSSEGQTTTAPKPSSSTGNSDLDSFINRINSTVSSGHAQSCETVAYEFIGAYYPTVSEVSSPQYGDLIAYYDANGNYTHTAVYLGNGQALHGNWSDGYTRVGPVSMYSTHKFYRQDSGGEYKYVGSANNGVEKKVEQPKNTTVTTSSGETITTTKEEAIQIEYQQHEEAGDTTWTGSDGFTYYSPDNLGYTADSCALITWETDFSTIDSSLLSYCVDNAYGIFGQ